MCQLTWERCLVTNEFPTKCTCKPKCRVRNDFFSMKIKKFKKRLKQATIIFFLFFISREVLLSAAETSAQTHRTQHSTSIEPTKVRFANYKGKDTEQVCNQKLLCATQFFPWWLVIISIEETFNPLTVRIDFCPRIDIIRYIYFRAVR